MAAIMGGTVLTAIMTRGAGTACAREGEKCAANRDCRDGSVCRDRRYRRRARLDPCKGRCVEPQTDEQRCGSCTESCLSGEICLDGSCFRACPVGSSGVCQDAANAACRSTFCNCRVRRRGGRARGGNSGLDDCETDADCVAAGWPEGSFCAPCGGDVLGNHYCVAPCQG